MYGGNEFGRSFNSNFNYYRASCCPCGHCNRCQGNNICTPNSIYVQAASACRDEIANQVKFQQKHFCASASSDLQTSQETSGTETTTAKDQNEQTAFLNDSLPTDTEATHCIDKLQYLVLAKVTDAHTSVKCLQDLFALKKILLSNCSKKDTGGETVSKKSNNARGGGGRNRNEKRRPVSGKDSVEFSEIKPSLSPGKLRFTDTEPPKNQTGKESSGFVPGRNSILVQRSNVDLGKTRNQQQKDRPPETYNNIENIKSAQNQQKLVDTRASRNQNEKEGLITSGNSSEEDTGGKQLTSKQSRFKNFFKSKR